MITVGTDLVFIPQLAKQLEDKNSSFGKKTFTPTEWQYSHNHPSGRPERHLAGRFAAKEALIKAWSAHFVGRPPKIAHSNLSEIEIQNDPYGRPFFKLYGQFKEMLADLEAQVSISHDEDYATATVLLQSPRTER